MKHAVCSNTAHVMSGCSATWMGRGFNDARSSVRLGDALDEGVVQP